MTNAGGESTKVKIHDAEFEGEPQEIVHVLSAMGYGENPLRPLFPILPQYGRQAPLSPVGATHPVEVELPTREVISAFLIKNPNMKTADAVRALGGSLVRDQSSGVTNRVIYNRLFARVYTVERNLRNHGIRTEVAEHRVLSEF